MFRDPKNALLPNWSELPVGYNGRASSVIVSGTDIVRPSGQIKLPNDERPIFSATRKLDFELETAFIVGKPTKLEKIRPHVFDACISKSGILRVLFLIIQYIYDDVVIHPFRILYCWSRSVWSIFFDERVQSFGKDK